MVFFGAGGANEELDGESAGDGGILDRLDVDGVMENCGVEATLDGCNGLITGRLRSSYKPARASVCSE